MVDPRLEQARNLQRLGVHVQDMTRSMQHPYGSGRRHLVEIMPRNSLVIHVNRVQTPTRQRRIRIGHLCFSLFQPLDDTIDGFQPGPCLAIRVTPVEPPDIGVAPQCTFHRVCVSLDKTRHQNLVRETVVQRVGAPRFQIRKRPRAQNPSIAHSDMCHFGLVRVHRQDFLGNVNCGLGHGDSRSGGCIDASLSCFHFSE